MFFYALWFALITTLLSILLGYVSNPRFRLAIPLIAGIVMGFYVIVINPQFAYDLPGLLYYLNLLCFPLVVPMFIVASLVFIEMRAGSRFGKTAVFSGALVTVIGYLFISQSKIISLGASQWKMESLLWTACVLVISGIVFAGIAGIRYFTFRLQQKTKEVPDEGLNRNNLPVDMKKIVIPALCLIVLCSPFAVLDYSRHSTATCGAFDINEVNKSMTDGNKIIHLTEGDFSRFSRMKPVIRDGYYGTDTCDNIPTPGITGNCVGSRSYPCNEEGIFAKYGNYMDGPGTDPKKIVFLEYGNRFYYLMRTRIT